MNTKRVNETVKCVATGLMVGGIAFASLGVTGCNYLSDAQVVAIAAGSAAQPQKLVDIAGKLAANHNETFLMGTVG